MKKLYNPHWNRSLIWYDIFFCYKRLFDYKSALKLVINIKKKKKYFFFKFWKKSFFSMSFFIWMSFDNKIIYFMDILFYIYNISNWLVKTKTWTSQVEILYIMSMRRKSIIMVPISVKIFHLPPLKKVPDKVES